MSAFPDRTVAQAIVYIKAYCRGTAQIPVSVELVENTPYEHEAWAREAEKYLIARSKGVKWKPEIRDLNEEIFHD